MSGKYAAKTSVPAEQSRAEIERTLARYGATGFAYGWDEAAAVVAFRANGYQVRFHLPLPDPEDTAFTHYRRGQQGPLVERTESAARDHYNQAVRQRWRALALCVKAKLEAVDSEITTFEEEFLAHIVLPTGETMGQRMIPEVVRVYEHGGALPALMPGSGS